MMLIHSFFCVQRKNVRTRIITFTFHSQRTHEIIQKEIPNVENEITVVKLTCTASCGTSNAIFILT